MLPWTHATISLVVMYCIVSFFSLDISTGLIWILVGGIFGTFIDLDHLIIYSLHHKKVKNRLKALLLSITEPTTIGHKFYDEKYFFSPIERIISHLILTLVILISVSLFFDTYTIPIGIPLIIHIICDLPDIRFKTLREVKKSHKFGKHYY